MSTDDLSPMPTPTTQDPELYPGGVDAIADDPADSNLSRDLSPDDNPAVDDVLPDEVAEADDKQQAPDGAAGDSEPGDSEPGAASGNTDGPDAGQTAEDGSAEPPA